MFNIVLIVPALVPVPECKSIGFTAFQLMNLRSVGASSVVPVADMT